MTIAMLLKNTVAAAEARAVGRAVAAGGPVKRTPLYDAHRALEARCVDFAGWEMPVQYSGIIDEHWPCAGGQACSTSATWEKVEIRGAGALAACQAATANDVTRLRDGTAQYSLLLTPAGRHRRRHHRASPRRGSRVHLRQRREPRGDVAYLREHVRGAEVVDRSDEYACWRCRAARDRDSGAAHGGRSASIARFAFADGDVAGRRPDRPHRLHRRGRLGAVLRAERCPRAVGRAARGRPGGGDRAGRARGHATRCGSKPHCRSMGTSSARTRRRSRRG
jgi:hypothetical protein